MKCPRCGFMNKPNVRFCGNCGLLMENMKQPINKPSTNSIQPVNRPVNPVTPAKQKKKGLGIGAILGIFAVAFAAFLFMFVVFDKAYKKQEERNIFLHAKQEAEAYWEKYCEENYNDIIEVSISHLHDNDDFYNGKNILTVATIDDLDTDSFSTDVQNDHLFFDGARFNFKQYNDELKYYREDETVIVVGTVDGESVSWADVCVKDCHIIGSGGTAYTKAKELNEIDYSYETTAPPTTLSESDIESAKKNAESQYAKAYSDVDATEIEINRLYDNKEEYIGKTILTAVKIDSINDDNFKVNIQNGSTIFYDVEFRFKEYNDELEYYKEGDFVIVYGTVNDDTSSWSPLCVTDCHIIGSGDEAKQKAKDLT